MWRTARALDTLLEQLNARYPTRSKVADGAIGDEAHKNTVSDHNPDAAGIVRARDFTHDPEDGLDAGALADALLASRDPRIKYIISNGRIGASYHKPHRAAWTWGVYTGVNAHRSHVHVSVLDGPAGDDPRRWAAVDPTMPPRPRPIAKDDDMSDADVKKVNDYTRALLLDGYTSNGQDKPSVVEILVENQRRITAVAKALQPALISAAVKAAMPADTSVDTDELARKIVLELGKE